MQIWVISQSGCLGLFQRINISSSLEDNYITKGKRNQLCKTIENKGIRDKNVLNAIQTIPRHFFFEPEFQNHAYADKAFPISQGQTISQPYTVAFQTELLEIKEGDKVLEVGTGSGYQAAVLAQLKAAVYSVEIIPELSAFAKSKLNQLGLAVHLFVTDGGMGWPNNAPYDKIIVTAGAPTVPSPLIKQLKEGGVLVIPIGKSLETQKMVRLTKTSDGLKQEVFGEFSFVPFTGKMGWASK